MENQQSAVKMESQQKLITELTSENEQLYHQYNHLIVRNGKLLKRIEDMQQMIDAMHLRMEDLQLTNDNLLRTNEALRKQTEQPGHETDSSSIGHESLRTALDSLNRRIDELHLRNDILQQRTTLINKTALPLQAGDSAEETEETADMKALFLRWKNFPGQDSKNTPNLRKQSQMLAHLYRSKALSASELFSRTGVNGVTGARYVAALKKFQLIEYKGARKKGQYVITEKGKALIEKASDEYEAGEYAQASYPIPEVAGRFTMATIENPDL